MRRAEHDIDGIRPAFQDRRHGVDHDFDAFVGRQQAEGQDDGLAAEAELGLRLIRLDERKVGNAVRNDFDLVGRHLIDGAQQFARLLRHHHDVRRQLGDPVDDVALRGRRIGQNGMKGRDDRHGQPRQQRQDMRAGFAAEDAEFMLKGDDVEPAGIQEVGRPRIVFESSLIWNATAGG